MFFWHDCRRVHYSHVSLALSSAREQPARCKGAQQSCRGLKIQGSTRKAEYGAIGGCIVVAFGLYRVLLNQGVLHSVKRCASPASALPGMQGLSVGPYRHVEIPKMIEKSKEQRAKSKEQRAKEAGIRGPTKTSTPPGRSRGE